MHLSEHSALRSAPQPGETVERASCRLAACFREAGLATPELDARLLVCMACGITHEQLIAAPERLAAPHEAVRIEACKARRLAGEPVSRIVGRREFRGLDFAVAPPVLDPRPDTETLVEAAIELAHDMETTQAPLRLLDLGTGSGCILVSLLHELDRAEGVGCDADPAAVSVARANAGQLGVGGRAHFFCGSWAEAIGGTFDLVVSNPPYIPRGDIPELSIAVAGYDPHIALDGGEDGLACYREIAPALPALLAPGGWALFETAAGQAEAVVEIMSNGGSAMSASESRIWNDLPGRARCAGVRRRCEP